MMPWEREIYLIMLIEDLKRQKAEIEAAKNKRGR